MIGPRRWRLHDRALRASEAENAFGAVSLRAGRASPIAGLAASSRYFLPRMVRLCPLLVCSSLARITPAEPAGPPRVHTALEAGRHSEAICPDTLRAECFNLLCGEREHALA